MCNSFSSVLRVVKCHQCERRREHGNKNVQPQAPGYWSCWFTATLTEFIVTLEQSGDTVRYLTPVLLLWEVTVHFLLGLQVGLSSRRGAVRVGSTHKQAEGFVSRSASNDSGCELGIRFMVSFGFCVCTKPGFSPRTLQCTQRYFVWEIVCMHRCLTCGSHSRSSAWLKQRTASVDSDGHSLLCVLKHIETFTWWELYATGFDKEECVIIWINICLCAGLRLSTSEKLFGGTELSPLLHSFFLLSIGGLLAFGLGFSEFLLVSRTSSLTLSISGIFKVLWTSDWCQGHCFTSQTKSKPDAAEFNMQVLIGDKLKISPSFK